MICLWDVYDEDWLIYTGGTDKPGELCYNVSISNNLTHMVHFPTRIPDSNSHSPVLLDLFLSSDASICSTLAFPPLGNYDVVISITIDFPSNSKVDAPFHCTTYDYLRADWDGLRNHLRDVPLEGILKFGAFPSDTEFCEWIQFGVDVYIPHCKYQAKTDSSPCFSAACATAIANRNLFFRLHQQNKSLHLMGNSDRLVINVKEFLKLPNLLILRKQEFITSLRLGWHDFWRIADRVFNKGQSVIPPLFRGPEVLSSASGKVKLFAKTFIRTLILMTQISIYLLFLLGLI